MEYSMSMQTYEIYISRMLDILFHKLFDEIY